MTNKLNQVLAEAVRRLYHLMSDTDQKSLQLAIGRAERKATAANMKRVKSKEAV